MVSGDVKFMKTKWYPRPHHFRNDWNNGIETAVGNEATIYPILMHDEGLGAPVSYNANPEHASFVVAAEPNCYPESRVNLVIADMTFNMTKSALVTDNIDAVNIAFMPVFFSFKESYTAIDELTSAEVQDVLEMQTESTDRQGFPLYNNVNMKTSKASVLAAKVPGLTTDQTIEGVAFNPTEYYNMKHYYTNAGALKSVEGGLKWVTLTRDRPVRKFKIRMRSRTKRMNPYTFFGVLVYCPKNNTDYQFTEAGDTTDLNHVRTHFIVRYNEWNQSFDFDKV